MSLDSFTLDEQIQLCLHMLSTVDKALISRGKAHLSGIIGSEPLETASVLTSVPREYIRRIKQTIKLIEPPDLGDQEPLESLLSIVENANGWPVQSALFDIVRSENRNQAVEPLLRIWSNASPWLKAEIAKTLGEIGDSSAINILLEGLNSPRSALREAVVEALVKFKEPSTVETLIDLLHDPEDEVQARTATALARIGDPRAIQPLLEFLQRCDQYPIDHIGAERGKMSAIVALGSFNENHITDLLANILENRRGYDEPAALIALCKQGTERSLKIVSEVMVNRAELLAYIDSLGETRSHETISAVMQLLPHFTWDGYTDNGLYHSSDWQIWEKIADRVGLRRLAAEYLGRRANPVTIEALKSVLFDEDNRLVGQVAAALLRIGTKESYRTVLDWISTCPNSVPIISEAINMDLWDDET